MTNDELKKLVNNYQPNKKTLEAINQVSLLATVGPSATGKTTIMKALAAMDSNFHFVVGETSRQPRPSERGGVDLFFRKRGDILDDLKAGRLTQVVIGPNGDLYCTRVDNFSSSKINLFPLIPLGVKQFQALPLKFFATAFIVPDSFEHWQQWLKKQTLEGQWNEEKLRQRLIEAKTSFEFALHDPQMNFILNDQPQKAARLLQQVAHGQKPAGEEQAREVAQQNYAKLLKLLNRSSI